MMTSKFSGVVKRLFHITEQSPSGRKNSDLPRSSAKLHHRSPPPAGTNFPQVSSLPRSPHYGIKLATMSITPSLKLLSFRVSRNYLYFSFAKPNTDLLEFKELFDDEVVM